MADRISPISTPTITFSKQARFIMDHYSPIQKINSVESRKVIDECDGRCVYCGVQVAKRDPETGVWMDIYTLDDERYHAWDHVYPITALAPTCYGNIAFSCQSCNTEKSDSMPVEYLRSIYDDPSHATRFDDLDEAMAFFDEHYFNTMANLLMDYPDWMDVVQGNKKANFPILIKFMLEYGKLSGENVLDDNWWKDRPDASIIDAYAQRVEEEKARVRAKSSSVYKTFLTIEELVDAIPDDWVVDEDGVLKLTDGVNKIEASFLRKMFESTTHTTKTNSSYQTKVTSSLNLFLEQAHKIINNGDNGIYTLPSNSIKDVYRVCRPVDGAPLDDAQSLIVARAFMIANGCRKNTVIGRLDGFAQDVMRYNAERDKGKGEWTFVKMLQEWILPSILGTGDSRDYENAIEHYLMNKSVIQRIARDAMSFFIINDDSGCRVIKGQNASRNYGPLYTVLRFKDTVVEGHQHEVNNIWMHEFTNSINDILEECVPVEKDRNDLKRELQSNKLFLDLLGLEVPLLF